MNVLMLYPKFPEETFWNTARSIKLLWGRKAIMPPLGLLEKISAMGRRARKRESTSSCS